MGEPGNISVLHRSGARAFHQERRAYEELLPQLDGVPQLVSADPATHTLRVTTLPGTRADKLHGEALRAAHVHAGHWLRKLHGVPCPRHDPMPLHEALRRRARTWVQRAARAGIEEALRAQVTVAFTGDLPATDRPRVWCHRDYAPYNWLVDGSTFQVIDFEHSRPDHPMMDLLRVPDRAALLQGYGSLTAGEHDLLARLDLLHRLGTVVWEHEHLG